MANTPIYGFETPDDTDLVKDGALAIRTALDDVDTTLGTALNSNDYAGLVLVKKQTIGSAVSSVTVTNAFSATYENYKIVVSGGTASTNGVLNLKIGSGSTHFNSMLYASYGTATALALVGGNLASWPYSGAALTTGIDACIEVRSPFLAKWTMVMNGWSYVNESGTVNGVNKDTNSYTDFSLITSAGNMTNGTIYVYGYGAS